MPEQPSLACGETILHRPLPLSVAGWGFLGPAVGPRLIVASLVPHLLFAVFLWAGCRLVFRCSRRGSGR